MQELYSYQPKDVLADTQAQTEDSLLLSIPSQLIYGFLEGMTTLPVARWAHDEPTDMTEQIANSLGHLMGFVGINPVGVAGKVASKLFVKGTMGKYLAGLSMNTRLPSLPMYLGNKISNKINQVGLKPALEAMEFTRKSPILKDMAEQSLTLGMQMGIAGAPIYDWSLGAIEDRMKSGIMGALFGAGNSLIGNTFTRGGKFDVNNLKDEDIKLLMKTDKQAAEEAIKASELRNGLAKAAVSGIVFSAPSILQGAPLPMVLYDAALNAFFGYKESPYWMKQARSISEQFIDAPHLLLNPKKAITTYKDAVTWENLDTRVKDALWEMADLQLGGMIHNASNDQVSIPGLKAGEVLEEVYKNYEVIPNDQIPQEGQINKQDYDRLEQKYFIQKRQAELFEQQMKEGKVPDDETITEFLRESLFNRAQDTIGTHTRLGTLEYLRKLEALDEVVATGLSNAGKYEIEQAYRENGLSTIFSNSIDNMVKQSFGNDTVDDIKYTEQYKKIIGTVAKFAKDKSLSYIDFANEMKKEYGVIPDSKTKAAYIVANQSVPRLEVTITSSGNIRPALSVTERGKLRTTPYEPKPIIYDMLDGDVYEFSNVNDFEKLHEADEILGTLADENGWHATEDGRLAYLYSKMYNTKFNREGGDDFNLAFYSGHKDQSKFLVGKFLVTPDEGAEILATRSILKIEEKGKTGENARTLQDIYDDGERRWLSLRKQQGSPEETERLRAEYEHMFANNIAFIEKFHGKTLVEIADSNGVLSLKTQKDWMLEPFSLMKRTQGLNSRQIRFNAEDIAEELIAAKESQRLSQEGIKYEWSRYSNNGYEVSTKGDGRFSAMNAKLSTGETIELAYQKAKGYDSVKEGKGKKAKTPNFDYWKVYKGLWEQWAKENPNLIEELRVKAKGKILTDQFASTDNSQARALAEILSETSTKAQGDTTATKKEAISGIQEIDRYNVDLLRRTPNKVYLFGDNLLGYGKKGQAIIRDEPNAIGIPTKKKPATTEDAYFTDVEYDDNIKAIDEAFAKIPKDKVIVLPKDGIGTGLAELDKRAPKTFKYLQDKITALKTSIEAQGDTTTTKPTIDIAERKKVRQEAANALGRQRYIILRAKDGVVNNLHINPEDLPKGVTKEQLEEQLADMKFKVFDKKANVIKEEDYDAHLDGGSLMRDDIFEALMKSIGENVYEANGAERGSYKGIHIHQGEGEYGGMFAKKAIFKAPKELSEWMRKNGNIHEIEYDTTMKVASGRKSQDYYVKDGEIKTYDSTPFKVYERPWESGTYLMSDESYKIGKRHRLMKQLLTNISTDTPEGIAAVNKMIEMFKERIEGGYEAERVGVNEDGTFEVVNKIEKAVTKYLEGDDSVDEYLYSRLLNDKVGLVDRINIFLSNRDGKSWRFVRDEIFDKDLDNEWRENDESEIEYFKEYGLVDLFMGKAEITPELIASVNSFRNYTQTALKRYIMNELIKPKVDDAMTSTLTSQFPYVKQYIKRGEIYYGRDAKKMKLANGDTLEQAVAKAGDKGLEILVIRAPADSPSGIRVLKVKGFIDAPGNGAFMHPDEYYNLSGADNDIDKITSYFNMPAELKDFYRTKQNQWYDDNGVAIPAKDNPEYITRRYETLPFDPLSNGIINRNAYKGISILGAGLNHTNRMQNIHDWIKFNRGGRAYVTLYAEENDYNLAYFQKLEQRNKEMDFKDYYATIRKSKTGKLVIKTSAVLGDKKLISKHQRDIVNYAADASNGEPVKSIWQLKEYVNRDMWVFPRYGSLDIYGMGDTVRVYADYHDTLYDRLAALDSIYSDSNKYIKDKLPSGREVNTRYNIQQILKIAEDYYDAIKGQGKDPSLNGGVQGYMYRMYAELGKQSKKYFDLKAKSYYNWVGDAQIMRKLLSQANDWFQKQDGPGKAIAEFYFGKSNFGLAFNDSEYDARAKKAVETAKIQREYDKDRKKYRGLTPYEIAEVKAEEMAEQAEKEIDEAIKRSNPNYKERIKYKPNIDSFTDDFVYNTAMSDFRANDIMDLSSILNVIRKGQKVVTTHGPQKVIDIRNKVYELHQEYAKVRKAKAEGDKEIENEWVLKTMDWFKTIKTPEEKALAEAYLISSVPYQRRSLKNFLFPYFEEIKKILSKVPYDPKIHGAMINTETGKYSALEAYNSFSGMSENEVAAFTKTFAGNSKKLTDAILEFKNQGREWYATNFNDAIAGLPFVDPASVRDLFNIYQTTVKFAKDNVDLIPINMKKTREIVEKQILENDPDRYIPKYSNSLVKTLGEKEKVKGLDIYEDLKGRLHAILRRLPNIAPNLEEHFIAWQKSVQGIAIPIGLKDMTLPQFRRFVDYMESKTFQETFALRPSDFLKTPQTLGETLNFYDRKTNEVVMRIADGNEVRTVKIDMPSSRVNNSIIVVDLIQEFRNATYKLIDKMIHSEGDEELVFDEFQIDANGIVALNNKGERIKIGQRSVINPHYIKAQISYDDFAIIQEFAIADHEAQILKYQKNTDANHRYLREKYNNAKAAFDKLKNNYYNITFKGKTSKKSAQALVQEFQSYFKAFNQKAYDLLNDSYNYKRLFKSKYDDEQMGFGIDGYEESKIIRITDLMEYMGNEFISGRGQKFVNMGLNVQQLLAWNVDVYHYNFKIGPKEYKTIEKMLYEDNINPGNKKFWKAYAEKFEQLKAMKGDDGEPLYKILSNPPKENFEIPYGFRISYFPRREFLESSIRERMEYVLKNAAPDTEEFRKAQLWMINKGGTEFDAIEENLKNSLFQEANDTSHARISASISGHLKSRNGDYFIPDYRRDFRVYEGYMKDLHKQIFDTLTVSIHKHNMSRMEKEAITKRNRLSFDEARRLRMFMDIRMLDILGYPSQYPDSYVDKLKLEGTFFHKLTNDYWIRKKTPFIDKILKIPEGVPEEYRARRINAAIASLSNLEATWAMMPLLASPKFMVTNRFSGGMTTIVNAGMDYFVKAHRMSEVNKYITSVNSYAQMVDFAMQHGAVESFIKNELVLSQNVKLGDVVEFVKDVMRVYKEGKDMPITRMYELAKQRGITQEFVDKAAYFMRASEIKNRVYTWFAHYMKAHDMLFKGVYKYADKSDTLEGDPWLVAMANKGVAATQYLYDSLNRPAFARTALGKMLTRFQLFTYNNLKWRKQLMDNARYEDWRSENGKRLANLLAMDMMVLTLSTFFMGTMFSASLNQPYGWAKDLAAWLFGDEEKRKQAFFGSIPYPLNIVQPVMPPFTRFLINPIVALYDLEKFSNSLVWSMFPFGRMANETRKSIENPLLFPEKSFGIPFFTLIRRIQADYKRREKEEEQENPTPQQLN